MNAKQTVFKETFERPFRLDSFTKFSKDFFNNLELVNPEKLLNDYWNWTEFSYYIGGYYHVANFIGNDKNKIAVFAVMLKDHKNLDRARSMQRNFVKKLMSSAKIDGAIVAFFAENESKWRLSFVKLDYEFAKGKVTEKITPAKRYSYLVGEGEPCHTAMERLYPIFMNESTNPTIAEIEDAFSVEKVTKEFFERYKEKYFQLKEHLESNDDFLAEAERLHFTSEQFAKKLMGQLAFLYFIQKKGWLGVNAFPKEPITKKQYNDAFYKLGKASKEVVPKVFKQISEDQYQVIPSAIDSLSKEEQETLAASIKGQSWGTGPRQFLRELFKVAKRKNTNFFDEYLEPLFYDALNKKRGANDYYHRLKCRVPFLNGGLFEPLDNYDWSKNKFGIPNDMFSNLEEKGLHDADGILDIFDRYNFTMNEDEPLEKEVAVDPEMLGKIFENLLDAKDRKSKGAFYTPREIVHYMCQESLVNYLVNKTDISYDAIKDFIVYGEFMKDEDTTREAKQGIGNLYISKEILDRENNVNRLKDIDDALANIKVADPAVGSGAFPLGMISEIVRARRNITDYTAMLMDNKFAKSEMYKAERHPLSLKLHTIKNSIFAVDIEPSAVDITKLRLWLSLVVEQEINEANDDDGLYAESRNPKPLPNLDCNIRCGNSLIDELNGVKLINESELFGNSQYQMMLGQNQYESLLVQLLEAQDKLFYEKNHDEKETLKRKIRAIIDRVVMFNIGENPEVVQKYNETKNEPSLPYFLWQLEFARVFMNNGGFDVVIGNPPYVKEYTNSEIFQPLKNNQYYQGKMDFWYFFGCMGLDLLKENGIQAFIAPNNWITNSGASKIRNKVLANSEIKVFIDFGNYKVFDTAAIQTMVYVLQKTNSKSYPLSYSKLLDESLNKEMLNSFLLSNIETDEYEKRIIEFIPADFIDGFISFNKDVYTDIIKKIKNVKSAFLTNKEVAQGIVAPQENLNKKNLEILGQGHHLGEGIFVLNKVEEAELEIPENEKDIVKPFYTTDQMTRYILNPNNLFYILYTDSTFNNCINKYPVIKNHLDKYKDIITSDNKPYGLHRARDENFFKGERIVAVRKCQKPTFTYVTIDAYVSQTFNIIKPTNINVKYLVALLNSTLIAFWLKTMGKMQGNNYQVDKEPLVNIPIAVTSTAIKDEFIKIVDQIISEKQSDLSADTSALEAQIDQMVYELYGLTEEEIRIVEESVK
ncbi:MAG: N-6 DNA methylase [Candidatus Gastranaerophilales bacterium]|nr:N-6 DNA methylase [Candidatus Gastranaerophilales bacterium]